MIASFAACCRLIIWCQPADYQSWTNITRRWWHYSWSVDNTCRHYLHRWWHCLDQFQCHQRWLSMSPSNICLQMMTLLPPRAHVSSISLVCCFWPEHLVRDSTCAYVDKRTYHITYHLCICVWYRQMHRWYTLCMCTCAAQHIRNRGKNENMLNRQISTWMG